MELFFNILWGAFAMVCLSLWLRAEQREKRDRRVTFVALMMLVVMVFPVISVSDDLWAIQNPAEADSFVRRDPHASVPQSVQHAAAGLPEVAQAEFPLGLKGSLLLEFQPESGMDSSSCGPIQNRPPPQS